MSYTQTTLTDIFDINLD